MVSGGTMHLVLTITVIVVDVIPSLVFSYVEFALPTNFQLDFEYIKKFYEGCELIFNENNVSIVSYGSWRSGHLETVAIVCPFSTYLWDRGAWELCYCSC